MEPVAENIPQKTRCLGKNMSPKVNRKTDDESFRNAMEIKQMFVEDIVRAFVNHARPTTVFEIFLKPFV